ncbi:hypothetical protein ElyMa_005222100 [Elysia marginata]|uniref:Reverse transcriptase zinc-binding domain-containing protein n=1 Tax=Elysia marginata TaxID=1093978 RepID=A0AAV4JY59_9GAST|nr:hypothetical protein ElyMa_005222100 [Elysia marginata]
MSEQDSTRQNMDIVKLEPAPLAGNYRLARREIGRTYHSAAAVEEEEEDNDDDEEEEEQEQETLGLIWTGRNPFYNAKIEKCIATEEWRKKWENNIPTCGSKITNPIQSFPGFTTLKREHWVITKRLRTRHGKTTFMMFKWKLKDSPMCQRCSKAPDTTDHIVLNCPVTKRD